MKTLGFMNKKASNLAEKLDEASNVIPFNRVVRGGGGETFDGKDWLSPLAVGTRFLARAYEHQGPSMYLYIIADKSEKGVCLLVPTQGPFWVDPIRFSRVTELVEVLKENEQCDRPN